MFQSRWEYEQSLLCKAATQGKLKCLKVINTIDSDNSDCHRVY